eukprot:Filipodium_phascolosomae@DN299_c0_g1_i1.p1
MFQRGTMKEYIKFHSRLICARTRKGVHQSIAFEQNMGQCHAYVHPDGVACTVLTHPEYPMRVAFGLMAELVRIFLEKIDRELWEHSAEDISVDFKEGDEYLQKYQNPEEADKLTKVQKDLEDVQELVVKSLDEILKRGENLDSLMQKSEDLSGSSYAFYQKAKRNNQCCKLY